jgi:hypothetical protein
MESYYKSFYKNVVEPSIAEKKETKINVLEPEEYLKQKVVFQKMKLPELKQIAKHYKLHVSGNKPQLIDRIQSYLQKYKHSIVVQKIFRGYLVRHSFRLRGPAFKTRKCINDSDFYSLEPLDEIEFERFFSYADASGFVYGFDLFSLLNLFRTKNKLTNPYNREHMPFPLVNRIFTLFQIVKIVFPYAIDNSVANIHPPINIVRPVNVPTAPRNTPTIRNAPEPHPTPTPEIQHMIQMRNHLQQIQSLPLATRVREVFSEMDILGNYTNAAWFNELDKMKYARFYKNYYEWWNFRGRFHIEIKRKICVLREPFINVALLSQYTATSIEAFQAACLSLIEAMVYTGVDLEHRKLGALHVLTMLTMVSRPAREAMPWLYESVMLREE